jgi:hypothetical protein
MCGNPSLYSRHNTPPGYTGTASAPDKCLLFYRKNNRWKNLLTRVGHQPAEFLAVYGCNRQFIVVFTFDPRRFVPPQVAGAAFHP